MRLKSLLALVVLLGSLGNLMAQRIASQGSLDPFIDALATAPRSVRLSDDKVLITWLDGTGSTSNNLLAVVGSVSGTDITYGDTVHINSNVFVTSMGLVAFSSTKGAIIYEANLATDETKYNVLDISGTTITVGSTATFADGHQFAATKAIAAAALNSTELVVVYEQDLSSDLSKIVAGTVSGTTITWGTVENLTGDDISNADITRLSDSKFAVVYEDNQASAANGNEGMIAVGTVSSNAITLGTAESFESTVNAIVTRVTALSETELVILHENDATNDFAEVQYVTVSGTDLSFPGNNPTFYLSQGVDDMDIDAVSGDEFIVMVHGGSTDSTNYYTGIVSSNDITLSAPTLVFTGQADDNTVSALTTDLAVLVFTNDNLAGGSTTADRGDALVLTLPALATDVGVSITASTDLSCNGVSNGSITATATPGVANYTYVWSNGANSGSISSLTHTISSLAVGTYTVTVTDNNGTTATASTVLTQPSALGSSASVTQILECFNDTDGQVTASGSGGTTPYTYSWNTGETNAVETNLGVGTYSVTITDQNGCTDSSSVTITQPVVLGSSASVTQILECFNDTDGQVTASGSGGTTPYTFSWNTGGTAALETNLGAGTYSVTVTDQNACTDSTSVTITQPAVLGSSASVTQILDCFNDTDGQVTASGSGGTTPYTFSWNTGGTAALETNLGAGTYSVTVTDQNGCTDSTSVVLTQPAALGSSASVTQILECFNDTDGQVTASGSGGTTPYTFSWNTGGTAALETGLGAGTYSVTVTDQNGCTDSTSVTITQPAVLGSSASVTQILECFNDTDGQVTASGSGGTTPYTFSWNTGGTAALETSLDAGTYSVTITDQGGCTDSTSVTITQPAALGSSASVTQILECFNDTDGQVTASGSGGTTPYTFSWNTGGTAALETSLGAGTYSVTITDQGGCTDSTSVTITQPAVLGSSASVTQILDCFNDTDGQVTASGSGGTTPYTFSWNTGGTAALETNLGAGTYSVTVTDQNGCTDSTSVVLTQPSSLTASSFVDSNASCGGFADAGASASVFGGTTPYTYTWSNSATTASITGVIAGTYSMTVTDQNGCTDSSSVVLTQPVSVTVAASVTSPLECNGDTDGQVTAVGSAGTTPYTYSWNTGGTAALETNLGAGTYSVTITDQGGCTDSTSVVLTQPTALSASSSVTTVVSCNGVSDGQVTASGSGGTTPYTFSWNTGGTAALETNLGAGTYSVTVTDQNGCTDSASVVLSEPAALVASASVTSALDCNGDTDGQVTASGSGGTTPYTYSWNTGGTAALETNLGVGTYSVTITDQNGCTDSASVILTQPVSIGSSASVTSPLDCFNDTDGQVTAVGSGGTTPYTYSWNTGGTAALETNLDAGTYSVTVTDQNGCTDSTSVVLTQPTSLSSSASVTSALNCNGDLDGQVTAVGSGGTTPYTFSWNTGGTAALETNLGAGTYSVTITDQNGCTDSTSVVLTEPTELSASSSVTTVVSCNGVSDGQVTAVGSGGTTPYTYSWNTGGTAALETNLGAGTYSVTVTDQNGCTDSTSVVLSQPAALVASASVTSALDCNGDTDGQVTASGSGGTTPYTYSWNTGGTAALETNLGAGTYSVTITDQNGCTDSASVIITQPVSIGSSASVTSTLDCNGDTDGQVAAVGSGGTTPYTYSWNTGGTAALETNLGAGTYSVTVTDQSGCTDSTSVVLTQPTALSSSASVTSTLDCFTDTDGQVTASGSGGTTPYTFSWNTGATTALETGLGAGTYSVTITDQNGCTDSTSVVLSQPAALVASASVTSALDCNGDTDGQVTASGSGGTTPYTYSWNTGGTAALETNLGVGTYSVTITDQNGCTDSTTVTLTQPTVLVAATVVDSNTSCGGFADGGATASATGGTGTYTYTWSNSATTASITGVVAGTYSVTITDQNGCTDSETVSISQGGTVSANITTNSTITCSGGNDGQVTAVGSGGSTPYTYSWSNGGTSATITNLTAGAYTVTVSDQIGCDDIQSVILIDGDTVTATITNTINISCNGVADGSLTASGSGGTVAYTYTWSNGATTATASSLIAGTYTVTINDANGCTGTTTGTVSQPTALVASATLGSNVSCNGLSDGSATASATGGTTAYTYAWSNGATTATITGVASATYSVTITDQNGCTDSASVTISEPNALVASAAVTSSLDCNGDTDGQVTASGSGGTTPYTYSWNNGGTTALETGLGAGTYSVTITDQNGCTDSASVVLSEPTTLTASSSVDSTATCNGFANGGATAMGSGGTAAYTYTWSNAATTASITGVAAGTYSVTVTDQNGCTDSSSVVIGEPSALTASSNADANVSCNGLADGDASASATGGTTPYTFAWSNGGTTSIINGLVASTYSVTITDANGCTDFSSVAISEPVALVAAATVDSNLSCNGIGDGGATASATGGTTAYTYAWSNSATTASITGVVAGTYTVTITDANGCTESASVSITEPTPLVCIAVADSSATCGTCANGGATASAGGGTMAYTYTWSNSATTASITGVLAGTYSVTITDANGCTDSSSVSILAGPIVSTSVDSNVSCNGFADGGATASSIGGTTPYTYNWSNTATTAMITGLTAGTYTVTVTDAAGLTNVDSVIISEPVILVAIATLDSNNICNGFADGGATASSTGGTQPFTYAWSTSATTASITGIPAGTYSVTITDQNGCTDSASVFISEPPTLIANATADANISCNGLSDGQATASATGGTTGYTFAWSTAATTATITGLGTGTYTVTITDANGCTDASSVTITEPAVLVASSTLGSNVSCNGLTDGDATASATGGTTAYTFAWSNGSTSANATGLAAGTYSVTITDANGCTDSASVSISEPSALVVTTVADSNVSCNGFTDGGATANVSGGTLNYTYEWSNLTTFSGLFNVGGGTYTVTVTDGNGCTDSSSVSISEPGILTTTVTSPINNGGFNITCFGGSDGSIDLTVNGGLPVFNYSWSGPNSFTSGNQNPSGLEEGTYYLTLTDGNGCPALDSITLTGPAVGLSATLVSPEFVGGTEISCYNADDGAINLTVAGGTPAYSYAWTSNNGFSSSDSSLTALAAGTYTLILSDTNNCSDTKSIQLTEPDTSLAVELSAQNFIGNVDILCNGTSTGVITLNHFGSGVPGFTYSWTGPNGFTSSAASPSGVPAGEFFVLATDTNGCTTMDSITLTEPAALIVSVDSVIDAICIGDSNGSAFASHVGGVIPISYLWDYGFNVTSSTVTGITNGTVDVTVTDAQGCTHSATATVGFTHGLPAINLVDTIATTNNSVFIAVPDTFETYLWSNGSMDTSITVVNPGPVSLTVTDQFGCSNSDTVFVSLVPTGISESGLAGEVLLYPNPTLGLLTMETPGMTTETVIWEVYSLSGQLMKTGSFAPQSSEIRGQIDLRQLAGGSYLIKVSGANSSGVMRIIVR